MCSCATDDGGWLGAIPHGVASTHNTDDDGCCANLLCDHIDQGMDPSFCQATQHGVRRVTLLSKLNGAANLVRNTPPDGHQKSLAVNHAAFRSYTSKHVE
ncbi:hypothetical protein Poly51_15250 [Rubripirellula tenax]|uniref:Uncharacterized protein n=1 Tax=Rubripirellula tenax TaxID=2528015 RepID=A0A5C6FBC8_9BACT|nr:hypothetical protein Poly51_15250 [Rubripirellula tenax]